MLWATRQAARTSLSFLCIWCCSCCSCGCPGHCLLPLPRHQQESRGGRKKKDLLVGFAVRNTWEKSSCTVTTFHDLIGEHLMYIKSARLPEWLFLLPAGWLVRRKKKKLFKALSSPWSRFILIILQPHLVNGWCKHLFYTNTLKWSARLEETTLVYLYKIDFK